MPQQQKQPYRKEKGYSTNQYMLSQGIYIHVL